MRVDFWLNLPILGVAWCGVGEGRGIHRWMYRFPRNTPSHQHVFTHKAHTAHTTHTHTHTDTCRRSHTHNTHWRTQTHIRTHTQKNTIIYDVCKRHICCLTMNPLSNNRYDVYGRRFCLKARVYMIVFVRVCVRVCVYVSRFFFVGVCESFCVSVCVCVRVCVRVFGGISYLINNLIDNALVCVCGVFDYKRVFLNLYEDTSRRTTEIDGGTTTATVMWVDLCACARRDVWPFNRTLSHERVTHTHTHTNTHTHTRVCACLSLSISVFI